MTTEVKTEQAKVSFERRLIIINTLLILLALVLLGLVLVRE